MSMPAKRALSSSSDLTSALAPVFLFLPLNLLCNRHHHHFFLRLLKRQPLQLPSSPRGYYPQIQRHQPLIPFFQSASSNTTISASSQPPPHQRKVHPSSPLMWRFAHRSRRTLLSKLAKKLTHSFSPYCGAAMSYYLNRTVETQTSRPRTFDKFIHAPTF